MQPTRVISVRWTTKFLTSQPGRLVLYGGHLVLVAGSGEVFSVSQSWPEMDWPWFGFGSTLRVKVGDNRYLINFIPRMATVADSAAGSIEASIWAGLLHADPSQSRGPIFRWLSLALIWKGIVALSILLFGLELLLQSGSWIGRGAGVVVILFAVIRSVMRLRLFRAMASSPETA